MTDESVLIRGHKSEGDVDVRDATAEIVIYLPLPSDAEVGQLVG